MSSDEKSEQAEGTFTVLLALGANLGVAVLKLLAGLISGSGALLSEAVHSLGDSTTEVLLLVALRRSDKPADRTHPFGYGKERYFWSLLAAVAIFVSGAAFSVFQGLHTIFGPPEESHLIWINYPVLAFALILESISFRNAAQRVRKESAQRNQSVGEYVLNPRDPTVNSIAIEDSTAIVGLFVAGAGVALHQVTGSRIWDGLASLVIGGLLLVAAFLLARACEGLLIGRQADTELVRGIEARLESHDEIVDVVDLLTMLVGTGRILVCARVDFVDTLSAGDLELACVRIDAELRDEFEELDEIFIQPASRADATVRERVRERYGRVLAEE